MSPRIDRQTIVVGIDDSPTALNAARWAAYLACAFHAPLLIACAAKSPSHYRTPAKQLAAGVQPARAYAAADETLQRTVELVHTAHPDLAADTVAMAGPPDRALVELSEHARIVVVGGQTAFEARMTGPTTVRVMEHAHCPVAVWRGTNGRPIARERPVAVGVDGSAASAPAIAHGFEIAAALAVSLVAVHAWPSRIASVGHHLDRAQNERVLLAECLAGWREEYPDVDVTEMPVPGLVDSVLTDVAEHAQLLVVGSRGRGTAAAALLGSTSRNLLHHATCPVLVCRATGRTR
ncbi:universal stress protein [Nocardia brasiliensis]|uniref:universal stress protein n=1 Tax=Nocardia brasiliensis TaxID=37326 RepID=UPI0004A6B922|nr:universal stress protein [Nocardia brasiliensis]